MPHKSLSSPFSTFYPYYEKNYTPSNTDAIIYDLFRLLVFFFNVFQQRYTGQIGSEGAQAVSLALYPSAQGQPSEAASPTLRETRPRLRSGQRSGRPRTRLEALQIVPTRCPMQIYTYLKSIAPYLYPSLTQMFEDMLRRFFTERPWEHGLHWRQPKSALTVAGKNLGQTGWMQVNMRLPEERVAQIHQTAQVCGISHAGVCYTALFWWAQYVYPPMKMIGNPASATKAKSQPD